MIHTDLWGKEHDIHGKDLVFHHMCKTYREVIPNEGPFASMCTCDWECGTDPFPMIVAVHKTTGAVFDIDQLPVCSCCT